MLLQLHSTDPPRLLTINPLQGGFHPHLGCLHTTFILQETIQHLREHGRKAFVAFLDVKKVFDTVLHEGVLVKLHGKGSMVASGISSKHGMPILQMLSNGMATNLPTSHSYKEYAKVPSFLPSYTVSSLMSCWTSSMLLGMV